MKKSKPRQPQPAQDYYRLKTEAVDDLVNADASNSPEVSEEELRRYGAKPQRSGAAWVKVCAIKFWFPAAVCYFFFWGLGGYMASMLDLMVVTAIVLGMVTDILTNNAIRFFAASEGANDAWMMFPRKRYATFFWNILYAGLLMLLVFCLYTGINMLLVALLDKPAGTVVLGVEPVLFGIFYLLWDLLLVWLKNKAAQKLQSAKYKSV